MVIETYGFQLLKKSQEQLMKAWIIYVRIRRNFHIYVEYIPCGDHMNRVRETRLQLGLTQEELSKLANVSQKHISLIENNQKPNMSLTVGKRIAKALGKTVDYLWPD